MAWMRGVYVLPALFPRCLRIKGLLELDDEVVDGLAFERGNALGHHREEPEVLELVQDPARKVVPGR